MKNIIPSVYIGLILSIPSAVFCQEDISLVYIPPSDYSCIPEETFEKLSIAMQSKIYTLEPKGASDESEVLNYIGKSLEKSPKDLTGKDIETLINRFNTRFALRLSCRKEGTKIIFKPTIYAPKNRYLELNDYSCESKSRPAEIANGIGVSVATQIELRIKDILDLERNLEQERRERLLTAAKSFFAKREYSKCISLLDTVKFLGSTKDSLLGLSNYQLGIGYYDLGKPFDQKDPIERFKKAKGYLENVKGAEGAIGLCDRELESADYFLQSDDRVGEWWDSLEEGWRKYFEGLYGRPLTVGEKKRLLEMRAIEIEADSGLYDLQGLRYVTGLTEITIKDPNLKALKGVERLPYLMELVLPRRSRLSTETEIVENVTRSGLSSEDKKTKIIKSN